MSEYLIKDAIVEAYGHDSEDRLIDLERELELAQQELNSYDPQSYEELWGHLTPEELKLIEEF
jgi:hypothetical protein